MKHTIIVGVIAGTLNVIPFGLAAASEPAPSVKAETKAAESGDKAAMYALGLRYLNGDGVAKDPLAAVSWFYKAVRVQPVSGYAAPEYELGKAFETGNGVEENMPEAYMWYSLAARLDPQYAQFAAAVETRMTPLALAQGRYKLGEDLVDGVSAPPDRPAALQLFMLAAGPGYREAQHMVGYMHDQGLGTPVNRVEAARWYLMAAEQDWHAAQHDLGVMYERGEGVPIDLAEAWKWHFLSARNESYYASAQRSLEARMTEDQITESKARADAWRPSTVINSLLNPGGRWP